MSDLETLVVFGANDIAAALLRWAPDVGFATVLVEHRPGLLTDDLTRVAGTVTERFEDAQRAAVFDAVHVDHDAPGMAQDIAAALRAGARTVSLLASKRRASDFRAQIAAIAPDVDPRRVNTPAGLDLGGRSSSEIALSVLAGLVAARYGRAGGWLADG